MRYLLIGYFVDGKVEINQFGQDWHVFEVVDLAFREGEVLAVDAGFKDGFELWSDPL